MSAAAEQHGPRLAVLISGRGRNLQALIDAVADGRLPVQWAGVLSNRPEAEGLQRARNAGIPAHAVDHTQYADRMAFDAALGDRLEQMQPDIIILAGFMRVLGAEFISRFAGRMLNVHPSLLPKYRGLNTHRRALQAGDAEHGASVHFVTAELDGGPVVIQGRFSVRPHDDEQTLADRVMNEIELKILPQAVAWCARGELDCQNGVASLRGAALEQPLGMDAVEQVFL